MKGLDSRQVGFTLIELMIVTLIILILSGGSLTAYLNFNKSQSVMNDARTLSTEIYRVRTLASSLQYPPGCDSLKGYNLKSDDDLTGVVLTADCDPEDVIYPAVRLLHGSVLTVGFNITFLPGSGYLESSSDQQITLQNTNDSMITKTIIVGALGSVTGN